MKAIRCGSFDVSWLDPGDLEQRFHVAVSPVPHGAELTPERTVGPFPLAPLCLTGPDCCTDVVGEMHLEVCEGHRSTPATAGA
jgi:hypothetical protein